MKYQKFLEPSPLIKEAFDYLKVISNKISFSSFLFSMT